VQGKYEAGDVRVWSASSKVVVRQLPKHRYTEDGFKHTYGPEFLRVAGHNCRAHPWRRGGWPHHVRTVKNGGRDHGNLYPCCGECHTAIHNKGRYTYEEKHSIDIARVAKEVGDEPGAFVP